METETNVAEDTISRLFDKKAGHAGNGRGTTSVGDPTFLADLKAGSHSACEALVREHYSRVYNFIYHLCGEETLAQDLCQETFLKVWRNVAGFGGRSSLLTWMFTIARNTFLDEARKKKLPTTDLDGNAYFIADPGPLPAESLNKKERNEILFEAIRRLPEREKTVIALRYQEEMTFREVSCVLGVPIGTAKYYVSRGLAKLREMLGESEGLEK